MSEAMRKQRQSRMKKYLQMQKKVSPSSSSQQERSHSNASHKESDDDIERLLNSSMTSSKASSYRSHKTRRERSSSHRTRDEEDESTIVTCSTYTTPETLETKQTRATRVKTAKKTIRTIEKFAVPITILCLCIIAIYNNQDDLFSLIAGVDDEDGGRLLLARRKNQINRYPFNNLKDFDYSNSTTTKKKDENNVGLYWQIPRSGGTTLKHILGTCLDKIQATRTSSEYCDTTLSYLTVCDTRFGKFVNADTSDHAGIQRSTELDLVNSGMVDVVVSSRFLHATSLFSEEEAQQGKAFTIMRDPIQRAASTFYYLQEADWERHFNLDYTSMTLLDYAKLPETSHNWMVRWLAGKNAAPDLSKEDLEFAKQVLKRKFLVMLTDNMAESIHRLVYYMNWDTQVLSDINTMTCLDESAKKSARKNAGGGGAASTTHNLVMEGTPEYEVLKEINSLDVALYEYAKELFEEQRVLFQNTLAAEAPVDENGDMMWVQQHQNPQEDVMVAGVVGGQSKLRPAAGATQKRINMGGGSKLRPQAEAAIVPMLNEDGQQQQQQGTTAAKAEPEKKQGEVPPPPVPPRENTPTQGGNVIVAQGGSKMRPEGAPQVAAVKKT